VIRSTARAVALVAAVALALPGEAAAHAVLTHTTPHQSSTVTEAPPRVQLDFNEPVVASVGAVRVYDEDGEQVDAGEVGYPDGRQSSVSVDLEDGLGRGIYTTTYRVTSADGHPVSGGFAFGVGEQVTTDRDTPEVAELLARSSAGAVVEGTYGLARGLHYAALLLLLGAVVFRLAIWRPDGEQAWPGRLLLGAAAVGLVSSLAGLVLQGALGTGTGIGDALDSEVLEASLDTKTGEAWLLRAITWGVVLLYLSRYRGFRARGEAVALAALLAVIVGSLPYGGHAATQSPEAVLIPADVVHVVAAGAWLGCLVLLIVCFWPWRSRDPAAGAAEATSRFSRLAIPAIVVLVVAGSVQAWFYMGSIGAFFDTTYGLALLAKIVLLAGIIGLAAGNRRRAARLAAGASDDAPALRRAMRAEVLLAVLVIGATATLVRAAPPETISGGPVLRELDLGPMRLQMDIEPGSVGPTDYHLYLFDRRTGEQIDRVKELRIELVQPEEDIGPIELDIPRKGPAHYELRDSALGVAGTWEATVTARVSAFDEYSATTEFEIRDD